MKTNLFRSLAVLLASLALLSNCDLIQTQIPGLTEKKLTADEAKVEIRAANQEIISTKDAMFSTPGLNSLKYLMELLNNNMNKSAIIHGPLYASPISYSMLLNYFRNSSLLKSATLDDNSNYGIMKYDFASSSFVMVEESSTMLQIHYPANEVALTNQVNNAVLTMDNLEFEQIPSTEEYWDETTYSYQTRATTEDIPSKANVALSVNGTQELTATFISSYNSDGMPTVMSVELETGDYLLSMSFSGAGVDYRSNMEYSLNSELMMAYDFDIKYTTDQSNVEILSGYYRLNPLKFDGTVNSDAIDTYMAELEETGAAADLTYLNTQIDMKVIQTDNNAKIGVLEYKMYYDAEWDEEYPEVALVYEDDSYDWLADIMTFAEL